MLPDVQSAEKCWKIPAISSQDYSSPAKSDIVNCGTPVKHNKQKAPAWPSAEASWLNWL